MPVDRADRIRLRRAHCARGRGSRQHGESIGAPRDLSPMVKDRTHSPEAEMFIVCARDVKEPLGNQAAAAPVAGH